MKPKTGLQDWRGLTTAQLSDKIKEHHKELLRLRQELSLGTLKNVREITRARKAVAQLMTILDESVAKAAQVK